MKDQQRGVRRVLVAAVAGAGLVLACAGAAVATNTGWKTHTQASPNGNASFSGNYMWYSKNDNHGGFRVKGTLSDKKKNNRPNMFLVRVAGYAAKSYYAPKDSSYSVPDLVHWDYQMLITPDGYLQTCEDSLIGNDCSSWKKYLNPYYK